jgi:membrane protease subunit HflK
MPWQDNSDGSGSQGGPKRPEGEGPKSPWGDAPPKRPAPQRGGGPGGTGGPGNDIEAFLRRTQDKLRDAIPGGGGGGGGSTVNASRLAVYGVAGVALLWIAMTSTFRINAQERGVVMRFGKYVETVGPGFHFKLPAPIDTVLKPKVEQVNSVDIGAADGAAENLMLTGDQNIIDIAYAVRWKIKNPELYLFELAQPEQTIRETAESAMRSEIGKARLNDAIGPQRAQIAEQVRERMQEMLDSYRGGIEIRGVDIKQADPPAAVDEAFKDVSAAQQDAQQALNQSRGYAQQLLAVAQGATAAFDAVYAQYRLAPEVTRKRMYLETMEDVLGKTDMTVIEPGSVQTYLPLSEVQRRAARSAAAAAPATEQAK